MFVKVPKILQNFFPKIVWRHKTHEKKIWLTFDDGPDEKTTNLILEILKKLNIKATFFLIGKKIRENPELFQEIIKQGHVVANHSYSHRNGWLVSTKSYLQDIEKCQKFMPKNSLFRPPYGKISRKQLKELKNVHYGERFLLLAIHSSDFHNSF